jgi:DNA invertase Pin-like site-specific DNA recombinase
MRCAIYARYSSELQTDASIDDQVRQCKARIKAEGWRFTSVYSDRAISGATSLRSGYQAMLADARGGKFDMVLSEALDRLSRDQEDVAGLYKQLTYCSVRILTLSEGEISALHVGLKGTMNALFLKDLAIKTRRGLEGRVRQGLSGGGNAYGYDVIREFSADGTPARGKRKVNDEEARTVQRIFAAFADGQSPRAIAHALNREGVPGPHGTAWGPSTIYGNWRRGTGILNNDLYVGRLVWKRVALEARLSAAPAPKLRLHPNLAELYRQKVAALADALNAEPMRVEAAAALRGLVQEVRLVPVDGKLRIELFGELAALIQLASGDGARIKHPRAGAAAGVQVTLVAGRGFEPLTFRL